MSDTSELKPCPKCGGPIPAEAPQGLCPKCLLAQASIPTEAGKRAGSRPIPPTQQELAAAFPQLEVLELIGQGGMGFVFKARQPKLERLVALKILPQSLAADPAFADRFTREGRLLARLNHPNIVTIHDFGHANGFFYLLMEFVDGLNLREAMRAGRFTPEQALAVVPRICDALQFAHNEGILHRDIKPENILLDSKGRIKIADFGIAKLVGEPHSDAGLTAAGGTLGTPHYMAPEQVEKPATVDHRADIYSLGVVFYEMLTGELPLGKFQPPSQKVQVDVRLDEVVLHALEKEPARRYQHVSEVKTAVDTIASVPPFAQAEPRPAERKGVRGSEASTQKPDRFWRRFAIAVTLFIAALILVPMGVILLAMIIPNFVKSRRAQNEARQAQTAAKEAAAMLERHEVSPKPKLMLQSERFTPVNPEPGRLDWGFKVFVPPDSLASVLFVRWSNGVPTVDPGFSAYYKVGSAGGIDVPFCSVSCYPISASQVAAMTNAENREMLGKWGFPGPAGSTNAVQWSLNLGLGFTSSKWMPVPAFHRINTSLSQSVEYGHQLSFPLVEFDALANSGGWSGVDLRIFLQPLRLPPTRTLPNEKDMTNYVGGTGITGTIEEALKAITGSPTSTALLTPERSVGSTRSPLFGSIIERVINDVETGTNYLLDLDTGMVSTLPPSVRFDDVDATEAWYRKAGVDVAGKSRMFQILCGRDLISDAVRADRWENPDARELNRFLENNRMVYPVPKTGLANISFGNELPTCLFKTREGNVGLLQITGVMQNPRGVKLRYKLLRDGETSKATTEGDAEASTQTRGGRAVRFAGATTHAKGVSLGTDSALLPGESLQAWIKLPNARIEEANTSLTIRCPADDVHTTWLLNYIFPDAFGSEAAEVALAQLDQNVTQHPVVLMPGERFELFAVTNKAGDVLVGYAEFRRSLFERPEASAGSSAKVQATVSNLHFRYTFPLSNALGIQVPEFDYAVSVPPGCALRATVNHGSASTFVSRNQNHTLWETRWLPAFPPVAFESSLAVLDLQKQVRVKQSEFDEQLRRLKDGGPIQVALGQPKTLFSVTNSAGEPFQGFFELVGSAAETSH